VATVWIVMTSINGYKNIFGHVLYLNHDDARRMRDKIEKQQLFDEVWVEEWKAIA